MPRPKREYEPATVRFIAMLRALDLAVRSYNVSHAQLERRLCDWMAQGHQAEMELRENPGDGDRESLLALVNRKNDVEQSGLARTDGRRAKAGGQRIGELLSGRFPVGRTPPRRRVDVCVAVLLDFLEENDPDGFAAGEYGTRKSWLEWWRQADQGQEPDIVDESLTVWGYLNTALEQLRRLGVRPGARVQEIERPSDDCAEVRAELDRTLERARQAEKLLEEARAAAQEEAQARLRAETERDDAVRRIETERDDAVRRALAERDEAVRRAARLRRMVPLTLGSACVALVGGVAIGRLLLSGDPVHTVEFAAPAQVVGPSQRPIFHLSDGLPSGRDWTLRVRLNVKPTDTMSACTYGMRITA
ncbi:MAG: hypothetical protein IRY90_06710, partial [Actinomadura rubrobrunea]|nr:hypothetical protein [Actinomadura rubrobrunea]